MLTASRRLIMGRPRQQLFAAAALRLLSHSPPLQQRSNEPFKFSQLQIIECDKSNRLPKPDFNKLAFGHTFTDHMFECEWREDGGWQEPRIVPLHHFAMHPAAKVLHYAQELFEGLKAFRGYDNKIRLFRPEMNMKRMLNSAKRSNFATFDMDELLACIRRLIEIERDWVPDPANFKSLYIRPTMIGIEPTLGVASAKQSLLYVILSPVSGYFAGGLKPVSLMANPHYVRAWPGGCGDSKLGSNYGPTVFVQKEAERQGHNQVLWLYGEDHQLTEVGTMNIFVYIKNEHGQNELVTPPLGDGLILPGVTRDSVLELVRKNYPEITVSERRITMAEVRQALHEKRLLEMFGAGTACCVCPVGNVNFRGENLRIPTMESSDNPLNIQLLNTLSDIQYGKVEHPWAPVVCDVDELHAYSASAH